MKASRSAGQKAGESYGRRIRIPACRLTGLPACWSPITLSAILLLAAMTHARADQGWEGHSLHLNWENDATRGSDRHYTQGARIRYLSSDEAAPGWLRNFSELIPALWFKNEALKFGFEVGQELYTPEDLDAVDPLPRDQPFAGWLYGAFVLQRRGPGPGGFPVTEQLRLDLGIIGPESLAENTQKVWHGRDPRGWEHQLDTEVAFALRYERQHLLRLKNPARWTADLIPFLDASAGTLDTHLRLGAITQFGYNIPNRFEVPGRRTPKEFGLYMYLGGAGRLVARNLFLDGNTWRSSLSVDKKSLVAEATAGLTLVLKFVELTAAHYYRTREFKNQTSADSYGSVTVSFKF
jgi:hypothetical protein